MDVGREWKLGRFEKGDAQKEKEAIRGDVATPAARFTKRDASSRSDVSFSFLLGDGGQRRRSHFLLISSELIYADVHTMAPLATR